MKIKLLTPDSSYTTVIDAEHTIVIDEAFIGPIITNGDLCVSIFARDGGFEMNVWNGVPDPFAPLPAKAMHLSITSQGVDVLKKE